MTTTDRYGMTELVEGQSGAETVVNTALRKLDASAGARIIDRDDPAPPGSPTNGAMYIVASGGTGAWSTHDGDIALYLNGWLFITPETGMVVYIEDEAILARYHAGWASVTFAAPTGTGFAHCTSGALDAASKLVENADVHASAAIALTKLATIAADTILGSIAGGTPAALACTAAGRAILDDADAAAQRVTLGVPERTCTWQYMWGPRNAISAAGTFAIGDASISDNTDMDGHVVGEDAADAARTDFAFAFFVPDELDVTAVVTATVYYRLQAIGTSMAVEIELTGRAVADNELAVSDGSAFNVTGGSCIKNVDTYASGDIVAHSLGTVFGANTLALGDLVKGTIFRDAQAGNADDTFTGTTRMIGVKFTGTRKTS